jgi:ABC-type nitrate/sulfonate/bicarbonate transport system substrate-binding protein
MKRRHFLAGAAAFASGPYVIGAARAADAVTVITPFGFQPDFIEVMNAHSGGHFARQGITARIIGANGSAQTMQQIVGGQAEFARSAGIDLINAAGKQKLPLLSLATLYQGSTFQLGSAKDKPVLSGEALKGKTVGIVSVGGATDTFLDIILTKVGLQKEDVRREVVGNNPGALEMVKQGRIDCFICSINVVVALERAGQPSEYWSMDRYAPMPSQIYIAAGDTVAAKPDLALRFVRAMLESAEEIMTQPLAPIFARAAKDFEIPGIKDTASLIAVEQVTVDKLWLSQGRENLMRNMPQLWQSGVDAMHSVGIVDIADASTLYTNRFIDAARQG